MLFSSIQTIEELIVHICARDTALTAAELHQWIDKHHRPCSLKAVYKALGKLEAGAVLVKSRQRYQLKLQWILDMEELVRRISEVSLTSANDEELIPTAGSPRSWSFNSLAQMDRFWTHIILVLLKNSPSKVIYDYVPHPWFLLIHHKTEGSFLKSLERLNTKFYRIIGDRTPLDLTAKRWWEKNKAMVYSFGPSPFGGMRDTHVQVIDDLVVTVRIEKQIATQLDRFYQESDSRRHLDIGKLNDLCFGPSKVKFRLEVNTRKARELRGKFERHFGSVY